MTQDSVVLTLLPVMLHSASQYLVILVSILLGKAWFTSHLHAQEINSSQALGNENIAIREKTSLATSAHSSQVNISPRKNRNGPSTRELSLKTRRQFVRQVEPLLLKNCSNTGCHGRKSNHGLQLERLSIAGAGHPKLTQQNLTEVLRHVSEQATFGSSLLNHAITPHGSPNRLSRRLSAKQIGILQNWLASIPPNHGTHASTEKRGVENSPPVPLPANNSSQPRTVVLRGSKLRPFVPRDPFDPEIFNRRSTVIKRPDPALELPR